MVDLLLAGPMLVSPWILAEGTLDRTVHVLTLLLAFAAWRAGPRRIPPALPILVWAGYGWMAAFSVPTLLRLPPWYTVSVLAWLLSVVWLIGRKGHRAPGPLKMVLVISTVLLLPLPHVTEFIGSGERPGYLLVLAGASMLLIYTSMLYDVVAGLRLRRPPREGARQA